MWLVAGSPSASVILLIVDDRGGGLNSCVNFEEASSKTSQGKGVGLFSVWGSEGGPVGRINSFNRGTQGPLSHQLWIDVQPTLLT